MKGVLVVIILIVIFLGAGYFGLPILIEKETAGLKSDVQDLKLRLQKIEEESKVALLKPDADLQQVIKTVNAVSSRVASLDDSVKKGMSGVDETIKKQKSTTEEALKKQSEAIDRINNETKVITQRIMFDATMANIRGYILKARGDLQYRNIGTVKTELDLISEAFEKVKTTATDENKKIIEELQGIVKKAKAELDTDLPAAINRIDLLWYEMGKLLKKV
jgi:vacuolar-type H+-ATPase subunit I/STV1